MLQLKNDVFKPFYCSFICNILTNFCTNKPGKNSSCKSNYTFRKRSNLNIKQFFN